MKINEIDEYNWEDYFSSRKGTLAEVLNNYNHPLFDMAFEMLDDKEFYGKQSDKRPATVDGGDR